MSGSSINRRITALSAVLTVTVREYGWLAKNPIPNVTRMPDSKGRERFLSDKERKALLAALSDARTGSLGEAGAGDRRTGSSPTVTSFITTDATSHGS